MEGWLTTTISPTYDEGSIGDGPTWDTRNTELNIHLSGSREKYLEEGLPPGGKLIAFLSNPVSFHNVQEIKTDTAVRKFIYGSYTSNNNITWIKN